MAQFQGSDCSFERNAIEIRLIDTQECPKADISICAFVFYLVKAIAEERYAPFSKYKDFPTERLADILFKCIENGGDAVIKDSEFLAFFGIGGEKARAVDAVKSIYEKLSPYCSELSPFKDSLEIILEQNLSSRIVSSLGKDFGEKAVFDTWLKLSQCLASGKLFY